MPCGGRILAGQPASGEGVDAVSLAVDGVVIVNAAAASRMRWSGRLVALMWTFSLLLPATPAAAEGIPVTYRDFVYPSAATARPTADKPQSKLWYQAGAWWALMVSPSGAGVNIFELRSDHTWRDTGVTVDSRLTSTADALWDNGKLYVASRTSSSSLRLYRLSYSATNRTYTRDSGFPVTIANGGAESITVARDSTGRLWTTWTQASKVFVSYSTTSDTAFSTPLNVPVADYSVAADDISAVISFGDRVGVMWSDQASAAFRFAVHPATSPPTTDWSMETPLAGTRYADDHLNLKSLLLDDAGRVHAAVKTSLGDASTDAPTDPLMMVLSRSATGDWSHATAAVVADKLTRPQLALDSTNKDLYILMTDEGGGQAYYKKAPLSAISFGSGKGQVLMSSPGALINNVSTTKDAVDSATGLVVIASDEFTRTYYHAEMSLGGTPPPADTTPPSTPTNLQASAASSSSVSLSWTASTDDVGVTAYTIYRDGAAVGTTGNTQFTDSGLQAGTTYSYTVQASDAAGNRSAQSSSVSATTPPAAGGIAFRSAATAANGTATTVVVPAPAGVTAGDVLVAGITTRGVPTVTAPAGWTVVRNDVNGTTLRQVVYTKVATTAEPASYTWTLSASKAGVGQVLSYTGVSTTAPVDVAGAAVNASSSSIVSPSVTTSVPNAEIVRLHGIARSASIAAPTGYVERAEVSTVSATYPVTDESADLLQAASGASGSATATASGSALSIGQTVALRPAG